MKPAQLNRLALLAYSMTALGTRDKAQHARAAHDLVHRARRLLELAAETASRNRWSVLEQANGTAETPEAQYAAACAAAVVQYPVHGEAKVYAALLNAVDAAHAVADKLYDRWKETQRTADPAPPPEPGVNRIGGPLAPGCSRAIFHGCSDEEMSS